MDAIEIESESVDRGQGQSIRGDPPTNASGPVTEPTPLAPNDSAIQRIDDYVLRFVDDHVDARNDERPLRVVWPVVGAEGTITAGETTAIVSWQGRLITTEDGARYYLGDPNSALTRWVEEQGIAIDWENPLAFDRKQTIWPVLGPMRGE